MAGLVCIGRIGGGEVRTETYVLPAAEGSVLAIGDVVDLSSSPGMDSGYVTCKIGVTGVNHLGVIKAFAADQVPNLNEGAVRDASTRRKVIVINDPQALFAGVEDGVGGNMSAANIGALKQVDLAIAAPNADGSSNVKLDSSTVTTTGKDMLIHGVVRDASNSGTQIIVSFNLHVSHDAT